MDDQNVGFCEEQGKYSKLKANTCMLGTECYDKPKSARGFEEERVSDEVWVGPLLGHLIKGRDCFLEMTRIEVVKQTVLEGVEAAVLGFEDC
ncbi:hypothetical protein NC651_033252 [Populus alba x Populus x berolinensis]|nr:hypothetical protein NC651_033252 [Populus alba x Populus x berolinensis]